MTDLVFMTSFLVAWLLRANTAAGPEVSMLFNCNLKYTESPVLGSRTSSNKGSLIGIYGTVLQGAEVQGENQLAPAEVRLVSIRCNLNALGD